MQSHINPRKRARFVPPPFPARAEVVRRPTPRTKAISSWDGWATFFSQLVIAFGFLMFGLVHFSYAFSGPFEESRSPYFTATKPASFTVQGDISWSNGVGEIHEAKTGRVYLLENANGVKELWQSGVHTVAINGHLSSNGALRVDDVSTP